MVQVETGDTNDFEPITDVYIILYGEFGDSGLRYLSKSKEGGQLFELLKVSRLIKSILNTILSVVLAVTADLWLFSTHS